MPAGTPSGRCRAARVVREAEQHQREHGAERTGRDQPIGTELRRGVWKHKDATDRARPDRADQDAIDPGLEPRHPASWQRSTDAVRNPCYCLGDQRRTRRSRALPQLGLADHSRSRLRAAQRWPLGPETAQRPLYVWRYIRRRCRRLYRRAGGNGTGRNRRRTAGRDRHVMVF